MLKPTALAVSVLLLFSMAAWGGSPVTIEVASHQATTAPSDELGGRLQQAAAQNRNDIAAQLNLNLYNLITDAPRSDLSALPQEDRDVLLSLIDGLAKFRSITESQSSATLSEKIQPLLEMADQLRDRANLTIMNLALCDSVERFGIYAPLSSTTFTAGRDHPAIVYFEVENFHPHQLKGGMWETKLKYELNLYPENAPSKPAYTKATTPVIDHARTRRRDFFLADKIMLPKKLQAGNYTLKVTLTDTQAHKVGEATLPIRIGE